MCSAPPLGPAFGTVNTSVSEDGVVISWDYFGHHKNVYVEYIVENSKASLCICSMHWLVHKHHHSNNYLSQRLPESNPSSSATPILGKEDWKKELVNGSHWHMIKGLKPGTSYRVRVVARDPADPTVHSTDEVLVVVPGEAACLRMDALCVYMFLSSACLVSPSPICYSTVSWSDTRCYIQNECTVVSLLVSVQACCRQVGLMHVT